MGCQRKNGFRKYFDFVSLSLQYLGGRSAVGASVACLATPGSTEMDVGLQSDRKREVKR